jgi:hypothetical protein
MGKVVVGSVGSDVNCLVVYWIYAVIHDVTRDGGVLGFPMVASGTMKIVELGSVGYWRMQSRREAGDSEKHYRREDFQYPIKHEADPRRYGAIAI